MAAQATLATLSDRLCPKDTSSKKQQQESFHNAAALISHQAVKRFETRMDERPALSHRRDGSLELEAGCMS
jgi:hypothetical protein